MSIIKYTTDGKKVVVIGDLNQTEKIVQEIFVTEDGAEIPSGERFVVKSLLDEPAKSWQEVGLSKTLDLYYSILWELSTILIEEIMMSGWLIYYFLKMPKLIKGIEYFSLE